MHLTIILVRREIFSGSKPSLEEQTAHGGKWTFDARLQGVHLARRGYHHTKACKARKREFLLTKTRSEELRAAEADAWRKPASSTKPPSSAKLSALHERKEHNLNLWTSSLNPNPTWGTPMWQQARRRQTQQRRGGRVSRPRGQTLQCRVRRCPRRCESGVSTRVR